MNKYTLKFKSAECEQEYSKEYRSSLYYTIIISGVVLSSLIIISLNIAIQSKNLLMIIIHSCGLCMLIFLVLFLSFVPKWQNNIYALSGFGFTVICTEFSLHQFEDKATLFFLGCILANLVSTTLKASNWITITTSVLLSSIYVFVRMPLKHDYEIASTFFLSLILIIHSTFQIEKHNRNLYINVKKKLNNERMWTYLIEEVYNEATILLGLKRQLRGKSSNNFLIQSKRKTIRHPSSSPLSDPNPKADLIFGRFKTIDISKKAKEEFDIKNPRNITQFLKGLSIYQEDDDLVDAGGINNSQSAKSSQLKGLIKKDSLNNAKCSNMEEWLSYFLRTDILARNSIGVNAANSGPVMERMKCVMVNNQKSKKIKKKRIDVLVIFFQWNNKPRVLIKFNKMSMKEKLQNLKRIDRYKDRFLASITHDLKTPLFGVESMIDFATQEESQIERFQQLKLAKINTQLLSNLINDILDYSQIRESKFKRDLNYFLLQDVMDEVLSLMKIQADFRNLNLKLINSLPKDTKLYSDSRRLKQVMINLIGNSLKFTTAGFVHIFICELAANLIKIEVIDSGAGIEESNIKSLAMPYNTLDNPKGMNRDGIGLGLFNCKNIISVLGPYPRLFISSKVGHGSKFGFVIFKFCEDNTNPPPDLKATNQMNITNTASNRNNVRASNSIDSYVNISKMINIDESRNLLMIPVSANNIETRIPNFHVLVSGENSPLVDAQSNLTTNKTYKRATSQNAKLAAAQNHNNIPKKETIIYDPLSVVSSRSDNDDSQKIQPENTKFKDNEDNFEQNFSSFASEIEVEDNSDYQYEKKVLKKNEKHSISPVSPTKQRQRLKWSFGDVFSIVPINDMKEVKLIREESLESVERREAFILIVDDNPFNLIILEKFLSKIDRFVIKVDKALNGQIAVDLFAKRNAPGNNKKYSIIFMDCQMPIMDGFRASTFIKTKIDSEKYSNCIILGFTSILGSEEQSEGKRCGMEEILQKPAKESFIIEVCTKYLEKLLD